MPSTMLNMNYELIIGPLLIGVIVNAFVFGICIVQLMTYSSSGFKDSWWMLLVVSPSLFCHFTELTRVISEEC